MKITELYRGYKIFWIKSQTNILLVLGIISILAWVVLGTVREMEMVKKLNKPTTLSVNDKVVLSVKKDSIKLTILKQSEDTLIKDTIR